MPWVPLGGKSRQYKNTETGEILSRRQYDKMVGRILGSYEKKAQANKAANLEAAVSRPARGRTKAITEFEVKERVKTEEKRIQLKLETAAQKKAIKAARQIRTKSIRPQLLKTGHRAERISFLDYDEYLNYQEQMKNARVAGMPLITAYGIGLVGFDIRDGKLLTATLWPMMTTRTLIDEEEFFEATNDFQETRSYFEFTHYFLHLHFNREYAESRLKKSKLKNLKRFGKGR